MSRLTIQTDTNIHHMKAGIGCSWHAIGPTAFHYDGLINRDNRSSRGSAFGGNPPLSAAFDQAWHDLLRHAHWLGLNFFRVEIDRRMFEPHRRQFTFDSDDMQILYRILDHCEQSNADVLLAHMHADVDWNAYPGVNGLQSAPHSVEDFAFGYAALLAHLVHEKGYSCIRWVVVSNEPGFDGCWWLGADKKPISIMPAIRVLRHELDERGLRHLIISGPDVFELSMAEFIVNDPAVGALSLHAYQDHVPIDIFHKLAAAAKSRQVPAFISEFGHFFMADFEGQDFAVGGPQSGAPKSYPAQLLNAAKVLSGLNLGLDGFSRWSYTNRGDLDGQWQLVRTFNPVTWNYHERVTPETVAYFSYGIITRFSPKYSTILKSNSDDDDILLCAMSSPEKQFTLHLLNRSDQVKAVNIELRGLETKTLHKYIVVQDELHENFELNPQDSRELNEHNTLDDYLPSKSITTWTSHYLQHTDEGII